MADVDSFKIGNLKGGIKFGGVPKAEEVTDRNETRANVAAGGWVVYWGDLINEADAIKGIISIAYGNALTFAAEQLQVQLQKFQQSMDSVSTDVVNQAMEHLKRMLQGKGGEVDLDGLGIKAGIVTYHRKMVVKGILSTPLPNNYQPYVAIRVSKALPPKGAQASANLEALLAPIE